jgi:antitoxin HicB
LLQSKCIRESIVKQQVHLAKVEEVAIRVRVQTLKGDRFLGTSPDVPGLAARGRSLSETIEIDQGLARKIVESCREHGDPLPPAFHNGRVPAREFRVPVMMP